MNDPRWAAIRAAVHTHQGMPSLRSLTASTGIPTSTVASSVEAAVRVSG